MLRPEREHHAHGPFSTLDLTDAERGRSYGDGPIGYSHSLTEQIGGQLAAGFVLTHLAEAPHHADATARYMPGYIASRAIKPGRVARENRSFGASASRSDRPGPSWWLEG
jgi:hypothetical protein